jgi:putative SOS response-associated peptidase YedK
MCNLYSQTKPQDAMRDLFSVDLDNSGNQPPLPGIFPDMLAPVIRNHGTGREMLMMRWGFPPPPNAGPRPVTNVRNLASPYWRGWMAPEWRCLVPATSFCEWTDSQPKVTHWFALGDERPLFAFAGVWRPWTGERKKETGKHLLFSILTTAPNDVVKPIHAQAMPVMLTTPEQYDLWLSAPAEEALSLQRPLPADDLKIVARGEKEDPAASPLGDPCPT